MNLHNMRFMQTLRFGVLLLGLLLGLSSCAVLDYASGVQRLDRHARWALLPFLNHTEVAQAGLRAEAITEVLLRSHGITDLRHYPASLNQDTLFEPAERSMLTAALDWARDQKVRYAVTGAVDEWHYKVGIDGEPAVGITLQIIDMEAQENVVWSAAGGKSGWSREALSAVAQKLISSLLAKLPLDHQPTLGASPNKKSPSQESPLGSSSYKELISALPLE